MAEFQVMLSSEQSETLQKFIYELATNAVEQVRKEAGLQKEWLRKGEMAEFIGIARTTLDSWIDEGLKISIVNGVTLISKKEVTSFLIDHQK